MEIKDFLSGTIIYDSEGGQYLWNTVAGANKETTFGYQMIGEVRGWGAIQNLFERKNGTIDEEAAGKFQDEIGKFIAEAINEKLAKT